jgi:hypothetical protein
MHLPGIAVSLTILPPQLVAVLLMVAGIFSSQSITLLYPTMIQLGEVEVYTIM